MLDHERVKALVPDVAPEQISELAAFIVAIGTSSSGDALLQMSHGSLKSWTLEQGFASSVIFDTIKAIAIGFVAASQQKEFISSWDQCLAGDASISQFAGMLGKLYPDVLRRLCELIHCVAEENEQFNASAGGANLAIDISAGATGVTGGVIAAKRLSAWFKSNRRFHEVVERDFDEDLYKNQWGPDRLSDEDFEDLDIKTNQWTPDHDDSALLDELDAGDPLADVSAQADQSAADRLSRGINTAEDDAFGDAEGAYIDTSAALQDGL
jgi:hypothetical protein